MDTMINKNKGFKIIIINRTSSIHVQPMWEIEKSAEKYTTVIANKATFCLQIARCHH